MYENLIWNIWNKIQIYGLKSLLIIKLSMWYKPTPSGKFGKIGLLPHPPPCRGDPGDTHTYGNYWHSGTELLWKYMKKWIRRKKRIYSIKEVNIFMCLFKVSKPPPLIFERPYPLFFFIGYQVSDKRPIRTVRAQQRFQRDAPLSPFSEIVWSVSPDSSASLLPKTRSVGMRTP